MGRSKLTAILLGLGLCGCGPQAALDGLADGGAVRVAEAAPDASVRLDDGRMVRLAGLIAPDAGEPFAVEARAALTQAVAPGAARLSYGGAGDGPAHLRMANGRAWVQAALLEHGAARVRTTAQDRALAAEMLRIEARARAAGRGLWALPAYQVRLPREIVAARAEGFQIVEGRVTRAADAGGRLFLEFGADWRGGFSTETPLAALAGFEAAGLDLRALQGRLIRVRGEVRPTAFGPRLRLDHPEQVERLRDSPK
jgi:micrococcal nuclease